MHLLAVAIIVITLLSKYAGAQPQIWLLVFFLSLLILKKFRTMKWIFYINRPLYGVGKRLEKLNPQIIGRLLVDTAILVGGGVVFTLVAIWLNNYFGIAMAKQVEFNFPFIPYKCWIPFVGITEELAKAILLCAIKTPENLMLKCLIVSIMFGGAHINDEETTYRFLLTALSSYPWTLYFGASKNLIPPILAHSICNYIMLNAKQIIDYIKILIPGVPLS